MKIKLCILAMVAILNSQNLVAISEDAQTFEKKTIRSYTNPCANPISFKKLALPLALLGLYQMGSAEGLDAPKGNISNMPRRNIPKKLALALSASLENIETINAGVEAFNLLVNKHIIFSANPTLSQDKLEELVPSFFAPPLYTDNQNSYANLLRYSSGLGFEASVWGLVAYYGFKMSEGTLKGIYSIPGKIGDFVKYLFTPAGGWMR